MPCTTDIVLADNGLHVPSPRRICSDAPGIGRTMECRALFRTHVFGRAHGWRPIDRRLTRRPCRWSGGQVGRLNGPLKDAIVGLFHHGLDDQVCGHLDDVVDAHNLRARDGEACLVAVTATGLQPSGRELGPASCRAYPFHPATS